MSLRAFVAVISTVAAGMWVFGYALSTWAGL